MWEAGTLNWTQFMLQWLSFSLNLLNSVKVALHLGKTPLSSFFFAVVIEWAQLIVYTHTSINSELMLCTGSQMYFTISLTPFSLQFAEQRPVTSQWVHALQLNYTVYYSSLKHKSLFPKYLIHFSSLLYIVI